MPRFVKYTCDMCGHTQPQASSSRVHGHRQMFDVAITVLECFDVPNTKPLSDTSTLTYRFYDRTGKASHEGIVCSECVTKYKLKAIPPNEAKPLPFSEALLAVLQDIADKG